MPHWTPVQENLIHIFEYDLWIFLSKGRHSIKWKNILLIAFIYHIEKVIKHVLRVLVCGRWGILNPYAMSKHILLFVFPVCDTSVTIPRNTFIYNWHDRHQPRTRLLCYILRPDAACIRQGFMASLFWCDSLPLVRRHNLCQCCFLVNWSFIITIGRY